MIWMSIMATMSERQGLGHAAFEQELRGLSKCRSTVSSMDACARDWLGCIEIPVRPEGGGGGGGGERGMGRGPGTALPREDGMASRYHEVYESWKRDPEGFWAEAAREHRLVQAVGCGLRSEIRPLWTLVPGRRVQHLPQCRRPPCRRRRSQAIALVHDSAHTGERRKLPMPNSRRKWSRWLPCSAIAASKRATASSSTCRWCPKRCSPCSPALVSARSTPSSSAASPPRNWRLGELATRIDDATPKLIISASCGIEPGQVVAYKPLLDQAIEFARHKPEGCIILQRPQQTCGLTTRPRHRLCRKRRRRQGCRARSAVGAGPRNRPALHRLPLRPTGQPKGVVRDNGGHMVALKWSMENEFGVKPGEAFWAASDVGCARFLGVTVARPRARPSARARRTPRSGVPSARPGRGSFRPSEPRT